MKCMSMVKTKESLCIRLRSSLKAGPVRAFVNAHSCRDLLVHSGLAAGPGMPWPAAEEDPLGEEAGKSLDGALFFSPYAMSHRP